MVDLVVVVAAVHALEQQPRTLPFIRGVNLGSTFIPEKWMVPSFYAGTGASSLCELVRFNRTVAAERMRRHLDSFVTEEDFEWLAARGFNSVRVPVGYWTALGAVAGIPYVPASPGESLAYLDRFFDWAEKYDVTVLLDLHGAPGSQNGMHHSGCDDSVGWNRDPLNFAFSLSAVEELVRRYAAHPSFLGIELLNEPGWQVEWTHGLLVEYYTRAVALVRSHSASALVVFNVLYWSDFPAGFGNWWAGQLVGPNVVLDLHLYDCYGNASQRSLAEHAAQRRRELGVARGNQCAERREAGGHEVLEESLIPVVVNAAQHLVGGEPVLVDRRVAIAKALKAGAA